MRSRRDARSAYAYAQKLHRSAQKARSFEARQAWREAIDAWSVAADAAEEGNRPDIAKSIRGRIKQIQQKRLRHPFEPYYVSKTYDRWDDWALEAGEPSASGYVYEDRSMSLRELLKEIEREGYDSKNVDSGVAHLRGRRKDWHGITLYGAETHTNIRTGEETNYQLHVYGSERAIHRLVENLP